MAVKLICVCSPRAWAKFIGWFNVVGYSIVLIIYGLLLIFPTGDSTPGRPEPVVPTRRQEFDDATQIINYLVVPVASFFFGIALLVGVYKENRKCLLGWMIFTGLTITLEVILVLVEISLFNGDILIGVISPLLSILIDGFCIYVVSVFRRDLDGFPNVV